MCDTAAARKRAEEGRCYIEAGSHFPEKGGDADGVEALDAGPAISRASGMDHFDPALLSPESLLTARKAPERSTSNKVELQGLTA